MRTAILLLACSALAAEPAAAATPGNLGPLANFPTFKCSLGFTGPKKLPVLSTGGSPPPPSLPPNYTCVGPDAVCEPGLIPGNLRIDAGKFKYDCNQPPG